MRYKGGLYEGRFDKFFKYCVGDFEILLIRVGLNFQFLGCACTALRGSDIKPVLPCFFAD